MLLQLQIQSARLFFGIYYHVWQQLFLLPRVFAMCDLYAKEIEGLFQWGGWRSGVLCQHPFGPPRLLLLLLWSPLWSKTCWGMCSHAYSIAKRNVLWCSWRDKRVSAMCEEFCLNLLSFCDVIVNLSHHLWQFNLSWGSSLRVCQTQSRMLKLIYRYLSLLWLKALMHTKQARKRLLWFS